MEGEEEELQPKTAVTEVSSSSFVAGRLKHYLYNWKLLTKDPEILNIVRGYKLEFSSIPEPFKVIQRFNRRESKIITAEITKFEKQNIIKQVPYSKDLYLSPIFTVPKKNGHRLILNLKKLNESSLT